MLERAGTNPIQLADSLSGQEKRILGVEGMRVPRHPVLSFGKELRRSRKTAHLSQRKISSVTGIDHSTISRLQKQDRKPTISTAVALVEGLKPNFSQKLRLIASLAKEDDKAYINDLLGLSGNSDRLLAHNLNTDISIASTPSEKAIDYIKRRNRSIRLVAQIGGIAHTNVSRFLNGEKEDMLGTSFIGLVRGLGLTTKWQVLDFFYSFGVEKENSADTELVEQKAS